ncbi:MAG: NAD(P)/FAD-dependent oxidoreductase [Acholeplasmataceae bacterium]
MKEIVIIGYGPAGISAAIYLKRAGFAPFVIGKDYGALGNYPNPIDNYYGLDTPKSGNELVESGIEQAKRLGIEVVTDTVIALDERDGLFEIETPSHAYRAKAVLLATGKQRTTLDIPGSRTFRGKGISLCATCDGYFYRKRRIGLIGYGAYMKRELEYLRRLSDEITVYTHGHELTDDIGVPIVKDRIVRFEGEERLRKIVTESASYDVDGAFIALGAPSTVEFATRLGLITDNGRIRVNKDHQTNIEGLFAAGDMIGGRLQIAKAVCDGMNAADAIIRYLK